MHPMSEYACRRNLPSDPDQGRHVALARDLGFGRIGRIADFDGALSYAEGWYRRPSDYESKSLRPPGAGQGGSRCSRRRGRPASAFLTCRVMAGGMTERMTVQRNDTDWPLSSPDSFQPRTS